jgi:hypothetical protein
MSMAGRLGCLKHVARTQQTGSETLQIRERQQYSYSADNLRCCLPPHPDSYYRRIGLSGDRRPSDSSAKASEFAAIALGGFALTQRLEVRHGLSFFGQFAPQLAAGLGLTVEGLGHGGRPAHLAEKQDFHLKVAAFVRHLKQIADPDLAGRLGSLSVGLNPADVAGLGRQRTSFEETGSPKPFVHPDARHHPILFSYAQEMASGRILLAEGRVFRILLRTSAITALAVCMNGMTNDFTLDSLLREEHIPVTGLLERERRQPINSYAVSKGGPIFLVSYYDYDGSQWLPSVMHVFRFDTTTGRASRGVLRSADISIDSVFGEISKTPETCLGSALRISEENGLIAIDTHINPSAGCVLLLDSNLRFKTALPGWVLGRLANQLIIEGNMMHFAPTSPESLGLFDPERRHLMPIYPSAGDKKRTVFSRLLREHLPSRSWCQEFNNPCDPNNFTTSITDVKVDVKRSAFSFAATMSAEGFGSEVERAIPPQTVRYQCVLRDGKWVLTSL